MKRVAAWLLPSLDADSVELRTILQNVQALEACDWESHLFIQGQGASDWQLLNLLEACGMSGLPLHTGWKIKDRFDLAIAAHWTAAYAVAQLDRPKSRVYYTQDFEPCLCPMGTDYIQAENALRLGIPVVALGRWLAKKVAGEFGATCRLVEFGADLRTFNAREGGRELAICLRCDPEIPHRCAVIGMEALQRLHKVLPNLKVYLHGSYDPQKLANPAFHHMGRLDPRQLNDLYSRCMAGVSLCSSNPSRDAFEMMAAGLPVVGLHIENSCYDLPQAAALLAEPNGDAVKTAVLELLADVGRRRSMSQTGVAFMATRSLQAETSQFVEALESCLRSPQPSGINPQTIERLYQEPPVPAVKAPDAAVFERRWPLVSFDVWDTMMRRRCHPDEIKLYTARYFCLKYPALIKQHLRDPFKLMPIRVQCEHAIGQRERAAGHDDEYGILEVFQLWIGQVANRVFTEQELAALSHELLSAEMEQEKRQVYPDEQFLSLAQRLKADQFLFASDFYMPAELVAQLLDHAGVRIPGLQGVVSCDCKLNKRTGRLFQHIQAAKSIGPAQHLHIGDNEYSDVFIPALGRMRSIHFWNEHEERRRAILNQRYQNRAKSSRPYLQEIAGQLRSITVPSDIPEAAREVFLLGVKSSILFFNFILFIQEQVLLGGFPAVHFFTREGEFFLKIYEEIERHNPFGMPLPKAQLLEVSRLATFAASIQSLNASELMRIWTLYSTQSMAGLLRSFDAEPAEFEQILSRHRLRADEEITFPWQDERVLRLLEDPEFQSRLLAWCQLKRAALKQYLSEHGISEAHRQAAIVDIGWRGTIQDNLAKVLPRTHIAGYYFGLHRFLNPQPSNTSKRSFGPNANLGPEEPIHLLEYVSPLEMICNSPHGSVLRYRQEGGRMVAERERNPSEDAAFEQFTRHFQAGILAAIPAISEFVRTHALSSVEMKPFSIELLATLVEDPPPALAKAYFGLNHNEVFGLGRFENKGKHVALIPKARSLYLSGDRIEFNQLLATTTWPQGFARLCDISYRYNLRCTPERTCAEISHFNEARYLLGRAVAGLKRNDYAGAINNALQSLAQWPNQIRPHLLLFHASLLMGRRKQAMQHFHTVQALCPNHGPTLNELAVNAFKEGDTENSLEIWKDILDRSPNYRTAVLNVSRLHMKAGVFMKAVQLLDPYMEKSPGDDEAAALTVAATVGLIRTQGQRLGGLLKDIGRTASLHGIEQQLLSSFGNLQTQPAGLADKLLKACKVSLDPAPDMDYLAKGLDHGAVAKPPPPTQAAVSTRPRPITPEPTWIQRVRRSQGPIAVVQPEPAQVDSQPAVTPDAPFQVEALSAPVPHQALETARKVRDTLQVGRTTEALSLLEAAREQSDAPSMIHFGRAVCLARLGKYKEAAEALQHLPEHERNHARIRRFDEDLRNHMSATPSNP